MTEPKKGTLAYLARMEKKRQYQRLHGPAQNGVRGDRRARRRALIQSLKNKPCAICHQEFHPVVMDFHHLDRATKKWDFSRIDRCSEVNILAEAEKCLVVCANCHRLIEAGLVPTIYPEGTE